MPRWVFAALVVVLQPFHSDRNTTDKWENSPKSPKHLSATTSTATLRYIKKNTPVYYIGCSLTRTRLCFNSDYLYHNLAKKVG